MQRLPLIALSLALLCPAYAAAQTAKELQAQGVAALNAGRYADAVQALDASYRKEPNASALYNLGLAYKGLGHPAKALEAFEGYVRIADPKRDAKTVASVRGEMERLKAANARFALKLTPADAVIEIDGLRASPSKNELWVPVGKHKITVRAAGYETYQQELDVAAGRFDLEVRLREPSLPPDQRAAALVDEGMALQAAGSLQPALDKYKEAQTIYPTPRATAQMGLTEESLGDLGAAEQHVGEALAARKDPWIRENRKRLQAASSRLKRQLSTLEIQGSPEGAEVTVNDRPAGRLPIGAPVRVAGGSIVVRAKKPGYADYEERIDLPPRGKRMIRISMSEAPPVVAAAPVPVPAPAPQPQAAVPALTPEPAQGPVEPAPTELPPPEQPKSSQADIEAFAEARDELKGEPDASKDAATGFEMAINFGYTPWIGGPKFDGSSGMLTPQFVLGVRPLWPISAGLQIQGGIDLGTEGTKYILTGFPGVYVRGHIQRMKKQFAFDAWAGAGLQPFAMQGSAREAEKIDQSMIDPNALDPVTARNDLLRSMSGVELVRTIQSINVPLELGATFYVTRGFGIDLALALTFWLPQQDCLHDGGDRICKEDGLDSQTSFFVGGGMAFLP